MTAADPDPQEQSIDSAGAAGEALLFRRPRSLETQRPDSIAEPIADEQNGSTDAELASRARSGDRHAFACLYERYASTVHGVLLAQAPAGDAGDLVQEVFLLALRAIDRLEDPVAIGAWLLTIARNRARDAHRSRTTMVELNEQMEPSAEAKFTSEDDDEAHTALRTIQELPESYRETLILRLVEGLSGPEIAQRTGLTHGSVRINLHRGMKLLREQLERAARRSTP